MIKMLCLGGPFNGRVVRVRNSETKITPAMIARGRLHWRRDDTNTINPPAFGSGYYAPQDRVMDGRAQRVLRWEGEL